jgi:hypothetical protein
MFRNLQSLTSLIRAAKIDQIFDGKFLTQSVGHKSRTDFLRHGPSLTVPLQSYDEQTGLKKPILRSFTASTPVLYVHM